ncbi:MAG: flagellar biosynthesis protein FlgJ [Desulfobacteraceae bacterium]|nr:flagellar biosynthesis protein FlgJ [Desulfobacteraceae bacterium]
MDIDLVNQNLAKANLGKVKNKASDLAQKKFKENELKEACAGFEAIFLNKMIKSMRDTLPGDGLFQESNGMDIYKSMYDRHLADEMSNSEGSVGLKEFLYNQLKKSI